MTYKVTLPTGDVVSVPKEVPQEKVRDTALRFAYDKGLLNDYLKEQERQAKIGDRTVLGEISVGLGRGIKQTKALVGGAGSQLLGIGLEKVGLEDTGEAVQRWGADYYADEMQESEDMFPRSVEGLEDVKGVEDGARLVFSYVGEFLPDIIGMAATGGVGSAAAKAYAKKKLSKELAQSMMGDALKTASKKGLERGVIFGSAVQNIPASFKNLEEKGVPKEEAAQVGILAGAINSYLDKIFPSNLFGRPAIRAGVKESLTKKILKNIGYNGVEGVVTEGITEAAQEAVDIAAERVLDKNPELMSSENIFRMLNAGFAGAVGGGVAGGVKGGVSSLAMPVTPDTGQTLDQLSEEIITPDQSVKVQSEQEANQILTASDVDPASFQNVEQKLEKANSLVETTLKANKELVGTDVPVQESGKFSIKEKARSQKPIGDTYPETFSPNFPVDPFLVPETRPDPVSYLKDVQGLTDSQIAEMTPNQIKKAVPPYKEARIKKPEHTFVSPEVKTGGFEFRDPSKGYVTDSSPRTVEFFQNRYRELEEKFLRNEPGKVKEVRDTSPLSPDEPVQSVQSFIRTTPVDQIIRPEEIIAINDPSIQNRPVKDVIKEVEDIARQPDSPLELLSDGSFLKARDTDNVPFNTNTVTTKPVVKPTEDVKKIRPTENKDTLNNAVKVLEQKGKRYKVPLQSLTDSLKSGTEPNLDTNKALPFISTALSFGSEVDFAEAEPAILETWRLLKEESDLLTPKNRQDLLNSKTQMINTLSKEFELSRRDVAQFGQDEVEAQSFALYSNYKIQNKRVPKMGAAGSVFNKAFKFLNDTGNTLRSTGINSPNDLFNGGDVKPAKAINEMATRLRNERYQVLSENNIRRHNEMNAANSNTFDSEAYKNSPFLFKAGSITSAIRAASRSPVLAPLVNRVMKRDQATKNYHHHFFSNLQRLFSRSNEQMRMLFDIASEQKLLRNKAFVNKNGELVYKKKGGKTFRLKDKGLSEDYIRMQSMFQDVLAGEVREMTNRVKPLFEMYDIPSDISLENLETFIDNNLSVLEERDVNTLREYVENVRSREKWGEYDYVPYQRFGNVGVVVEDKTLPNTGEKGARNVAFITYETDKNGKPKKESVQEFQEKLKEYKKDPKRYKISNEFSLTRNQIFKFLNDRQITLELISQLMNQDNVELVEGVTDMLKQEAAFKGFAKHFSSSQNLDGFSTDARRVLSSYFMNASNYLGGLEHTQDIKRINLDIQSSGAPQNVKTYAQNFLDSNTSMEDQWINIRAFNYFYTMGFNFSTGLLQLVSLMTTVPGAMTQYSGSILKSGKYLAKATKNMASFTKPGETTSVSAFDFYNQENYDKLIKKGKVTKENANILRRLTAEGYLQPGVTNENVGAYSHMSTLSRSGLLKQKAMQATKLSGFFLQTFEEQSRMTTAMATLDMLDEPGMLEKAHDYLMKYDALYKEMSQGIPDKMTVVQRTIDTGLGHFGREARAPYQNTWVGAFAVPFSTFPHQMMENLYDMAKNRGPMGRKAFIKSMIPLVLLGGVWAAPGSSLMKELFEYFMREIKGEDIDLEGLIMEEMNELFGTPTAGVLATQGAINAFLPIDVSRRVSLEPPGQNALLAVTGIRGSGRDILGVPGSAAGSIMAGIQDMYNGKAPLEALSSALPAAFKNLYRGMVLLPNEGLKYRGSSEVVVQPEKYRNVSARGLRSLGFTPRFEGQAYRANERIYRLERELDPALRRYRNKLIKGFTDIYQGSRDKNTDRKKEGQQNVVEAKRELRRFLAEKNYPEAGKYFQRTVKNAVKEARRNMVQRRQPQEVRKRIRPYLRDIEDLYGINDKEE